MSGEIEELELAIENYQSGLELDRTYLNFYWSPGNVYKEPGNFVQVMDYYCQSIEYAEEPTFYVANQIENEGGCE